jgi:hypothetical protein
MQVYVRYQIILKLKTLYFAELCLVPSYLITTAQLTFPLLLRLSQLAIPLFNLKNRWLPLLSTKEIPFLHHKIATPIDFLAVVTLHGLVKREVVFGYVAFLAVCVGESAVGVAESVGFVLGFLWH